LRRYEAVETFVREQKKLPHWQGPDETYFIRFSLHDNRVPDLTDKRLAPHVLSSLRYHDNQRYLLFDYTVMPDHIHCILKPLGIGQGMHNLLGIICSVKCFSATQINRILGRSGRLWQEESYDHVLRNLQDYEEKSLYIYMNPVKAGLVQAPADWPWWDTGSGLR
jgi:type I restriction enzyme R subunit/putative DNA methylase